MPFNLAPLWNFSDPIISEERFRDALSPATGDDRLILTTQIARTYGLRKDFTKAREILAAIDTQIDSAGPEARAYFALEMGRAYASAAHAPGLMTPEAKAHARSAYQQAIDIAKDAHLDALAIDAMHMMAFVDTDPVDQLTWAQDALAVAQSSAQPAANRWEASLLNNIGQAQYELGLYYDALMTFNNAAELRELGTNQEATRTAHWMVAWTLRVLDRAPEALGIQLRLERECAAAGAPDPYVFEELEHLYRATGNTSRADHYAELKATHAH